MVKVSDIPGCSHRPRSQAQRLRFVLWCLWDYNGVGGDFEEFYDRESNKIIEGFKSLLPKDTLEEYLQNYGVRVKSLHNYKKLSNEIKKSNK